jgi:hypothetical protein
VKKIAMAVAGSRIRPSTSCRRRCPKVRVCLACFPVTALLIFAASDGLKGSSRRPTGSKDTQEDSTAAHWIKFQPAAYLLFALANMFAVCSPQLSLALPGLPHEDDPTGGLLTALSRTIALLQRTGPTTAFKQQSLGALVGIVGVLHNMLLVSTSPQHRAAAQDLALTTTCLLRAQLLPFLDPRPCPEQLRLVVQVIN